MNVDKVLLLAGRLSELKQRRDRIDAEIAGLAAELVETCQDKAAGSANGGPSSAAAAAVPPGTLQEKVYNVLLAAGTKGSRVKDIAKAAEHDLKKTRATLWAMRKKGAVRSVGRGVWAVAA
jgi:Ethanolamine utilization protein EutJ (predicted chaperonin)